MQLDLRDLRLVVAIDAEGGMTRASAVLNLTQSALSHQLADLERRLGAPLFMRHGRRLVLTPAGERMRDGAKPILAAAARLETQLRDIAEARSELLRFSTECYTCYNWLPALLHEYQREFPRVEARLIADATRNPIPALLRGELDLAIVSSPVHDRRIIVEPLFQDELVALVPPGHPWVGRKVVVAEDFADQHLIRYTLKNSESTLFTEVLMPAGVVPRKVSNVQLTEAIIELVLAGLGVAVLARWSAARELESGLLHAIRITPSGIQRQWGAARLRHKSEAPHIKAFVEMLGRLLYPQPAKGLKLLRTAN